MFLIGDNFLLLVLFYGGLVWLVGAVLFITIVLTLVYGATYYDRSEVSGHGRACFSFRRWRIWRCHRRVYRHRVVLLDEPPAPIDRRPCIYAATPHGVNALSFFLTFMVRVGTKHVLETGGATLLCGIFPFMFWLPLMREFMLAMGAISVERESLLRALRNRHDIALIPEGTREIAPPSHFKPKTRPGFLRLAWEAKGEVDCAYVYLHNEERNYWTVGNNWAWRQWMRDSWIGFAITFYVGACCCHPLTTYIGPRHHWIEGEDYDAYCQRWALSCIALRQAVGKRGI